MGRGWIKRRWPQKIIAFLAIAIINIATAIIILAAMLVVLNGNSESDAMSGIIGFVLLVIAATTLTSVSGFFITAFFVKRQYSVIVSVLIAVSLCSVVSFGLQLVSSSIGVAIAEIFRVNF